MKNIIAIVKKELRTYFNSPTAYIVLIVFLTLWEFFFFKSVFLVGEASLHLLFFLLPWLFLILIPALTMGSISQEKGEGTLELLLTHPVSEKELVMGKFLAGFIFVAIILLFIFPAALSLDKFGDIDWGVVFGQYLSGVFLAGMFVALGICISTLFSNQISSLLVAAAGSFLLLITGLELVTASLPLVLAPFIERISALAHYSSMARGVIDFADTWYFITGAIIFLAFSYLQLLKRKFGTKKILSGTWERGMIVFICIALFTNLLGVRIPGRIDLTQDQLYTLTSATKNTLMELQAKVAATLYVSDELPAQMQPVLREVKEMLRDYKTFGKGNIGVTQKNPQRDKKILEEALSAGIREVQFNVVEREGFAVKKGFLGLVVSYQEEKEAIPFIENTSDLEYSLTSFIKKLTTTEKKKVAFLSGHGEKNLYFGYRALYDELQKQFRVEDIRLNEATSSIPSDTAALIVTGPTQEIDKSTRKKIKEYIEKGGSAMILTDPVSVAPQGLDVSENEHNFADFLLQYGVRVNKDMVYDLRSNETVNFGGGFITYVLPYPFWTRVIPSDKTSPVTAKVESLTLPWASSIEMDENKLVESGFTVKILYTTTKFAGRQTESFKVDPNTQLSTQNLGERIMAVSLTKNSTRLIVMGDSDFLTDQFADAKYSNLAFGIEAISWLAQEESLAGIQLRQKKERKLIFENNTQMTLIKYGNMGLALLLPLAFGSFRIIRRRTLRKAQY